MKLSEKNNTFPIKKIIRTTFGILFLFFGVIGLFLPILQGVLFIIIGIFLLAPYNGFIRNYLNQLKRRHPKPYSKAQELKSKLKSFLHRS